MRKRLRKKLLGKVKFTIVDDSAKRIEAGLPPGPAYKLDNSGHLPAYITLTGNGHTLSVVTRKGERICLPK